MIEFIQVIEIGEVIVMRPQYGSSVVEVLVDKSRHASGNLESNDT